MTIGTYVKVLSEFGMASDLVMVGASRGGSMGGANTGVANQARGPSPLPDSVESAEPAGGVAP